MERLSLFIVSIIIASMVVLGIGVYYTGISQEYGVTNNQNVTQYNQLGQIQNITEQLNDRIEDQPTSTGGFAILGDFLNYGYNTLRLTFASYNLFDAMLDHGVQSIPTDSGNAQAINLIKVGLGSVVFVLFIFIIIAFWAGRAEL